MIFSRIVYCSILIGLATAVLLTSLQIVGLNPIIFEAEGYEAGAAEGIASHGDHGHSDHDHGHAEAWAPADGLERTAYSLLANILASTGFAAIMLALMNQFWLPRKRNISWRQGCLWGLAGFAAVFLAPAIGVLPEIPGTVSAPLEHRQLWWALSALSVAIGLGIFAFSVPRIKAVGLLFLVVPYIVGAPQIYAPRFQQTDPSVTQALFDLHQQFIVISTAVNLVFWLSLGLCCRFAFNRWFRNMSISAGQSAL